MKTEFVTRMPLFSAAIITVLVVGLVPTQQEDDLPSATTSGRPYVTIGSTGDSPSSDALLTYATNVTGHCGEWATRLKVSQVETDPMSNDFVAHVTSFRLSRGGRLRLDDPDVLRSFDGMNFLSARPTCSGPVAGLELLLSTHGDNPVFVRRTLQFENGAVSYFREELIPAEGRFRWIAP